VSIPPAPSRTYNLSALLPKICVAPEGGEGGGRIVAQGPPELVARTKKSYTGQALSRVLGLSPNGHNGATK